MAKRETFIFTGGGTGGHVAPALAIAEGIRARHPDAFFLYVGLKGKAEDGMVQKSWAKEFDSGLASIRFVRSKGFSGLNLQLISFALLLCIGIFQAMLILLRHRPQMIVATGGYVSAPIVFAAHLLRTLRLLSTKIFLHEQNAVLGRMNREAVRFADCVGTAFPGTKVAAKKEFVSYPVRSSVVSKQGVDKAQLRVQDRKELDIPEDAKVVFAFGGSQGARTINRGMVDALPYLLADPDVYVIHGTGRQLVGNSYNGMADVQERLKSVKEQLPADWEKRYRPTDFFYNMGAHYNATDLVVCRGGAGSLYEVCANGVAAISIPKANLPGDHQAANARSLERLNALRIIYERVDITKKTTVESIEPKEFAELVLSLLNSPDLRATLAHNAHEQYAADTTAHCALIIDALLGRIEKPESKIEPKQEEEKVLGLSDIALESLLRKVRQGKESLSPEERRIALYKIDGWAARRNLVSPARASRMFGEGRFIERLSVLEHFALDQTLSPFTRRDALKSLPRLEYFSPSIVNVLLSGLKDPYFEAITASLSSLRTMLRNFPQDCRSMKAKIEESVRPFVDSKTYDVQMYALQVLSETSVSFSEIEKDFRRNYFHPNWKVRHSIVSCFGRLIERGLLDEKQVSVELESFLQTSNGFNMHFVLKNEIRSVAQKTEKEQLVEDMKNMLGDALTNNAQKLREKKEFAGKHNLAMNITELLEKLTEEDKAS